MSLYAGEIKRLLTNSHYSLLFSSQNEQDCWFSSIKKKAAYQPLLDEIRIEANRLLGKPIEEPTFSMFTIFRDSGLRLEYERVYFEKRKRLNTFAIMALLEPSEPEYLQELHNTIWSICNEYTWALPAHLTNRKELESEIEDVVDGSIYQPIYTIDLFSAETAFTLSEILKIGENLIDPLVKRRMTEEVYKRVLLPFCNQTNFEWETSTHNWAAVCGGSIGSAAIHLVKDEEMLSSILGRVLSAIEYYLEGFNDDGACLEGYGYWQYGFGYFVYFADLLKKKTANSIDLFQSEKVHQISLFQQKCFTYKDQVVNFSDSTQTASVFLGVSHYLKRLYPDFEVPEIGLRAHYTEDHCSRWAPAIRNLLWFNADEVGNPWKNDTFYLPSSQWFISRYDDSVFACKGGHNYEPHNHNDVGHFILQKQGETLLKDLGSGMYCDGYFGAERYTFVCNGSQGHSVPIINNSYQVEGRSSFATIKNVKTGEDIDEIVMNLEKTYNVDTLHGLTREFKWNKKVTSLILRDTFQFTIPPISIVERFITPALKIAKLNGGIILVEGEQKLKITYDANQLEFVLRPQEFINHFGETENFFILDFIVKEADEFIAVEFTFTYL